MGGCPGARRPRQAAGGARLLLVPGCWPRRRCRYWRGRQGCQNAGRQGAGGRATLGTVSRATPGCTHAAAPAAPERPRVPRRCRRRRRAGVQAAAAAAGGRTAAGGGRAGQQHDHDPKPGRAHQHAHALHAEQVRGALGAGAALGAALAGCCCGAVVPCRCACSGSALAHTTHPRRPHHTTAPGPLRRYNLLHEEGEGYAKLLVRLVQYARANAPSAAQALELRALIGYCDVDPNRAIDVILQVGARCCGPGLARRRPGGAGGSGAVVTVVGSAAGGGSATCGRWLVEGRGPGSAKANAPAMRPPPRPPLTSRVPRPAPRAGLGAVPRGGACL